jgi:uncharacterized OsmC-like protein
VKLLCYAQLIYQKGENLMATQIQNNLNGIAVDQLTGMIEAVQQNPVLAQATFHSRTTWKQGFQGQAEIGDYVQAGDKVKRGRSFYVASDHPEGLLGQNSAPAAVETLIAAVGACISGGWATFGAAMNIPVETLEIDLKGDIDLQGFMGLGENVRPGLERIHGTVYVKSPASDEQLQQLKETAEMRSPVVDSLRVPVEITMVRL